MSTQNNDIVKDISTRVQDIIESGNRRRFIVRKANGEPIVNVTLTVALVTMLVAAIIFEGLFVFALIVATIIGITQKASLEIVKEIDEKAKNDDSQIEPTI